VHETESRTGKRVLSVDFVLPGTVTETAVGDTESRWVRCRANRNCNPARLFDFEVGPIRLDVGMGGRSTGISPDAMLATDVPLDDPADGDVASVAPFGDHPRERDTFYLAAGTAFTKPGATVSLVVELAEEVTTDGSPELSWEYAAGNAWQRLPIVPSETDEAARTLTGDGTITFDVPSNLTEATVAGHDDHWIRVRLVGGNYGEITYAHETKKDEQGDIVSESWEMSTTEITPPRLSSIQLSFAKREPPKRAVADNNLALDGDLTADLQEGVRPFERLPDDAQTLYFGFDAPLEDGPIQLLFSPEDRIYEDGFNPRIRWQYLADPADDDWIPLDARDGTESLLERGVVGLTFPERTTASSRFGDERHWIRAVVKGTPFEVPPGPTGATDLPVRIVDVDAPAETVTIRNVGDRPAELAGYRIDFEYGNPRAEQIGTFPAETVIEPGESLVVATGSAATEPGDLTLDYERPVLNNLDPDAVAILPPVETRPTVTTWRAGERPGSAEPGDGVGQTGVLQPCSPRLTTRTPRGETTTRPPVLRGLYPNTGWAENVETIEREVLGSSDGTTEQTFAVADPPVIDGSVWVNELQRLTTDQRATLRADRPEDVAVEGDDEPTAFWIRWTQQPDLLESGPDDRHYTLDRTAGRVEFGDGNHGEIPPPGSDNVRATYRTGGGADGNVRRGAVDGFRRSIPFVEAVTNEIAGDGGGDVESVESVGQRGPLEIKDRDKAVAAVDVERIAASAARKLARVRCFPGMDQVGDRTPGWVTVLIVPDGPEPKPVPSVSLQEHVHETVAARAPVGLVAAEQLVVRGPTYVAASVEAELAPSDAGRRSISALEESARRALAAFFDPVSGGPDGDGWPFGELPCPSDCYALLEGLDGVDHVTDLVLRFEEDDGVYEVRSDEETPGVNPDVLIYSGVHEVVARAPSLSRSAGGRS
jgi:hypothetical protein